MTAQFLKQGYSYNKIRKVFSKLYHIHSELIVNIGTRTHLQQGITDPVFYGDLVYKCNRIVANRRCIEGVIHASMPMEHVPDTDAF